MPLAESTSSLGAESSKLQSFMNKLSGQPASYAHRKNYLMGKTLGAGSFGVVKQAKNTLTSEDVAIKIILKKTLKGNEQMVYDELLLLKSVQHPHIVSLRDWFESKHKFYIVTQLATGGELFDRICDYGRFTESDAANTMVDILEAVDYLHNIDIVHRDLKPENLLYLTKDPKSELVLADFGIAKKLETENEVLTSMAGSFGYAAPEVLKGVGHGKPCDVWSIGVIAYTILCGYSPFRSESVPDFLNEVEDNNFLVFHERYWKSISKDAKIFILKCLDVDPSERPTTQELLKDPWILTKSEDYSNADLLPNIKEGFNARAKFRHAIEAVMLANRIKNLHMGEDDDDSDDEDLPPVAPGPKASSLSGIFKSATKSSLGSPEQPHRRKTSMNTKVFQEVVMAAARNKDAVIDYADPKKSETQ